MGRQPIPGSILASNEAVVRPGNDARLNQRAAGHSPASMMGVRSCPLRVCVDHQSGGADVCLLRVTVGERGAPGAAGRPPAGGAAVVARRAASQPESSHGQWI
jgi:hypothetical protein